MLERVVQQGDVFRLALPIPGAASGLLHHSFVLSTAASNDTNGYSLVASSHKGAKHPWAFFIPSSAYDEAAGSTDLFDTSRPIGVEQMQAVENARLSIPIGRLGSGVFGSGRATKGFDAHSAIRVQFALPGYEKELLKLYPKVQGFDEASKATLQTWNQFSVWECQWGRGLGHCVVVSNDKHNKHADHVQVFPIGKPTGSEFHFALTPQNHEPQLPNEGLAVTGRLELLSKHDTPGVDRLRRRIGSLTSNAYSEIYALFARLFGV